MDIYFCGTRGSAPAPGEPYIRYGGHTSCVGLARDGALPGLVLDAGTGLANLDEVLGQVAFRGTLLLGHLHWDHTHGMPFFAAGARPGHRVRVLIPGQGEGQDAECVLARAFSPPHFPVEPQALGEGWRFGSIAEGEHETEGFSVLALEIPHKGGRTVRRPEFHARLDRLSAVLPSARRVALPHAGHTAADNSGKPEFVATQLRTFFT